METLKQKWLLPLIAFVVAIGGAFASNHFATVEDAVASEWGYYQTHAPCDTRIMCDNTPTGVLCTVNLGGEEVQAFGKINPNATTCSKVLYQPIQP